MITRLAAFLITAATILGLSASVAVAQMTTYVTIGSGSATGLYYPTAVGIAKILNDAKIGVHATARETGGSVFNAKAMGQGHIQMALLQNNIARYAYLGEGVKTFEGKPVASLRAIGTLYPEVVHILARGDAGIKSPADLRGREVYIGDVGSGTEQDAKHILRSYGLGLSDIKPVRGSAGDAVSLLRDNRIAAMFYTVGLGSSAITEAAEAAPIKVIPIGEDEIHALHGEYSFYTPFTIPAGTYPGMKHAVKTVTLMAMLAVSESVPEEVVYRITKTLFKDKLHVFYNDIRNPNLKKYFTVESALDGVSIPLHPGAVRFFRQAGIKVPDRLLAEAEGPAREAG